VSLSVTPFEHDGVKVNLLDTPGYADFIGELRAGLRAADAAIFVVSAVDGVDATTISLWEECAAVRMPRAVVITRLDHQRADFDESVAVCQRAFGDNVLPLYLPVHADDGGVAGLIGLLSRKVYDYSDGFPPKQRDPDPEHVELIDTARNALIEGIIAESEDESLMDRYLGGEDIDMEILIDDLETAVARGSFHPVLAASAPTGLGCAELLEVLTSAFPSPLEHDLPPVTGVDGSPRDPLSCDPDGPLVAEVVKTTIDPYVGRVSLVRVFSGTLKPDLPIHVSGHPSTGRGHGDTSGDHDVDERLGHLFSPLGATLRPVDQAVAGDIVAVTKLTSAETGDTISAKDAPLLVAPWDMPEPLLPVAVRAKTRWPRGWRSSLPATRRSGWSATRRRTSWCCGAWARRTRTCCWTGCASRAWTWRRCRSWCRCGRPSPARRPRRAGTSSSPAGTGSTRSATSRWSRWSAVRGSSSSTRSSAGPSPTRSSRRWRRASGPRWSAG
jgi:elongation factor G